MKKETFRFWSGIIKALISIELSINNKLDLEFHERNNII